VPETLRIGFLGGVPPALGGGGLERQMRETARALRELGHDVVRLEALDGPVPLDLVHAFGAEPNIWHALVHGALAAPLVVTPVVVVSPGWQERAMRVAARVPLMTAARMRRDLLRGAHVVVAATAYERRLLEGALGVPTERIVTVPNGSDAPQVAPAALPADVPAKPFALLLGVVSPRKRQAVVLEALARHDVHAVVAGRFDGGAHERSAWERCVARTGATWLGHVSDPAVVVALLRAAAAFVHFSAAETQSLAVIEALSLGTPAVLSDIPSHRELADVHPELVRIVADADALGEAAAAATAAGRPVAPPPIPTWRDIAERLVQAYRTLHP
jgi:glycosyltransferase involved in cell wall biosynthesis